MRGHNVNIYFPEKTYNKIKDLIQQRKVSEFVNQAVERELNEKKKLNRERLIASYKSTAQSKAVKKEDEIWEEAMADEIDKK